MNPKCIQINQHIMHRQYCPDVFIFCARKCVKCSFFTHAHFIPWVFAFFFYPFMWYSCKHILERKYWVAYTSYHFVAVVRLWSWAKLLLQFHISGKSSAVCLLWYEKKKSQQSFLTIILIIATFFHKLCMHAVCQCSIDPHMTSYCSA